MKIFNNEDIMKINIRKGVKTKILRTSANLVAVVFFIFSTFLPVGAQNDDKTPASAYKDRYNLLVKNLGVDGVGIETLVNKWEADYPDDVDMLIAKFSYYFTKSKSTEIVEKSVSLYKGEKPVLSLKDSLGNDRNYFQVLKFNDELYAKGASAISKAIRIEPDRLDYRFLQISALIVFEGERPEMSLAKLIGLVDYNYLAKPKWEYPGTEITKEVFVASMQEYCATFFTVGSEVGMEAFKKLSEKMLDYNPKNPLFLDNMGSYYLVAAKDYKKALKYYNKVLKKHPDDYTAIKNCVLLARFDKNIKLEKKYLPKLIKYSPDETERKAAEVRLKALK